jgi:hypothetical protein
MWKTIRSHATPLAAATFVVVAVTGVMMFFHLGERLIKELHEWFGVAAALGVALHLAKHWKSMVRYLGATPLRALLAASLLGVVAFVGVAASEEERPRRGGGSPELMMALEQAALSELAPVLDATPEALVAKLEAAGVADASPEQTIADIAAGAGRSGSELLSLLAGGEGPR